MRIVFNKPFLTGNETKYIEEAVKLGKISGDGIFTKRCHEFLEQKYGFKKVLLTTSCTDALEMAALLTNIKEGDEVIAPSYTFVSTVNAFVLRGAKIVFCDSKNDHPNIDENKIENLITSKTKVIIAVHYAGCACNMDKIMEIAHKYSLIVIEDAAQAIDNYYIGKNQEKRILGSIGHLATFSFHETKNIISGEGGMLVINDDKYLERAEIIREKGTNRSAFFRGEVDKYSWVDIGSSFLPSDIIACFLLAQLENIEMIQARRLKIWNLYFEGLKDWAIKNAVLLPKVPDYSTNNAHMFYLVTPNLDYRTKMIEYLKLHQIMATFHYVSLHKSEFYKDKHDNRILNECEKYTENLLRLPLYFDLMDEDVLQIVELIKNFQT